MHSPGMTSTSKKLHGASQKLHPVSSVMQKPRIALLVRLIDNQKTGARGRAGAGTLASGTLASGARFSDASPATIPPPPAYGDMDPLEFSIELDESAMDESAMDDSDM